MKDFLGKFEIRVVESESVLFLEEQWEKIVSIQSFFFIFF